MEGIMQKIVIIGGGFAGLNLARKLAKKNMHVVLVDKQNHHMFQPLFYQVASARLEPSNISFPFRALFRNQKQVEFRYATVERVDAKMQTVFTSMGEITYDKLVIATGCRTNFFGNEALEKHTMAMKSTQQTIHIRNTILTKFEQIMFVSSKQEESELMNIVIVGAGPTGVELAGALAEMKRKVLPKDYPQYDFSKLNIVLLEGSPNTLNAMSPVSQEWSKKYLLNMGVDVRTSTVVEDYDGHELKLKNGNVIPTQTVVWAAGVQGNTIEGLEQAEIIRNRYKVDRHSKVLNLDNVFAIGDISYMETEKYPNGHPQVANVAINQGKCLAKNLVAMAQNQSLVDFEYKDKGTMATVGKHKAVVELPGFKFQGYFAWMVWMTLHLMLILSIRNKIVVFFNWAWRYITGDTSLRLILRDEKDRNLMRSND